MQRILLIEDDRDISNLVRLHLADAHYTVDQVFDGQEGLVRALERQHHLIILDLMLPGMDGIAICQRLRAEKCPAPVLMLTSKAEEIDKVLGLESGADDYMTKPFSVRELLARIHAILRREHAIKKELDEYAFGSVVVDFRKQEATRKGKAVKLSVREYAVLKFLILHEGEVVTRDMLLNEVWGYETFPTTRTVDNYILALRKKLEGETATPRHLLTVHTAGYKFVK